MAVEGGDLPRLHPGDRAGFTNQLHGLFIHADQRAGRIICPFVQVQNVFHAGDEFGVLLGRNYPALSQMRFEAVFFRTLRTVSCEMLSTMPDSTISSAGSRNDQRDRPGGVLRQARAMRCASPRPSRFLGTGGVCRFLRPNAASSPCSTNRLRTLTTVLSWRASS